MYGIKEPRRLTDSEIVEIAGKLAIRTDESFVLDEHFFNYIYRFDTLKSAATQKCSPMISKYQQPLQIFYFNESGQLISYHNNCNTGGFPKLNWNKNNQFVQFVPKTTIPVTDSVITLGILLPFIRPLSENTGISVSKYTVVVFWSGFMKKQSKELIRVVRENLKKDSEHYSKLYFVNVDNFFAENKN